MAEEEGRSNGNGGEGAAERAAQAKDEVAEQAEGAQGALGSVAGRLGGRRVLLPVGIAAATAAAGLAATRKGAPKVKEAAFEKTEEAGRGAVEEAKERGGITGLAAGVAEKMAGRDGGGDGGGLLESLPGGEMVSKAGEAISKLTGGGTSQGWGRGRRNPIQHEADVGVDLETAYNQWTQMQDFPKFMHRVQSVEIDEEDRTKARWQVKIWFSRRQWEAQITDQVPNERIAWKTVSGTGHVGTVTFHELDDDLTRVLVNLDFNPTGLFEKMASGLRFVKRASKSDLYRYKAFIETQQEATGAWRGRIEDGEVVEEAEVEPGQPIEAREELRTPERVGEEKKPKKGPEEEEEEEGGPEAEEGEQPEAEEGEQPQAEEEQPAEAEEAAQPAEAETVQVGERGEPQPEPASVRGEGDGAASAEGEAGEEADEAEQAETRRGRQRRRGQRQREVAQ